MYCVEGITLLNVLKIKSIEAC